MLLRRLEDLATLRALVTEAAFRHRSDREYLVELAVWSGRYASTAGVPARSVPGPDGGIHRLDSRYRNYETCLAVMCFAEANRDGRYDKVLENADRFLKSIQWGIADPL